MAQTQKQWTVAGKTGFDSLKLNESAAVPQLGDKDVLVKCTKPHSISLIYNPNEG